MTIEPVREALNVKPFQPFRLQLGDGTHVDVLHPECLSFYPKGARVISVALPNGAFKIIDLTLASNLSL